MQYTYDNSIPRFFAPDALDTSGFIDITGIGDEFRSFIDTETGVIHRCKDYFDQYLRQFLEG